MDDVALGDVDAARGIDEDAVRRRRVAVTGVLEVVAVEAAGLEVADDGAFDLDDLVGRDAIVVKDGMQITEFRDGILPWAYQNNVALVFGRAD